RDALGVLHHEAARGGRAPARGDQLPPRRPGADLGGAAGAPRPGGRALHRLHRRVQLDVGDDRAEHGPLPVVPAHRGRDGGQGLHRRARERRPAVAGGGDRARRLRVPGAEVLGGEPRVRAAVDLARGARPHGGDHARHAHGRRHRLPQLHGRGDRRAGAQEDRRVRGARRRQRAHRAGRRGEGRAGLLHRAHPRGDHRPGLPHDVRGDLRPPRHGPRVRGRALGGDAARGGRDEPLRPHRRDLLARPQGGEAGERGAAQRRRQLLHQRQAHRRRGGAAAVRRRPLLGHQRQGGVQAEPRAVGERAEHQGDLRPAHRLQVPVHGRGV
ncbi:MAG: Delta-1-pyrroline-5-carboxylate dehydrogenase, partial [uncultured Gemmatimonadaceae bacterium]